MDCNKVEALRKVEIAGRMISSNDYIGARDKLHEAWDLFPVLDDISEMINVCDILCTTYSDILGYGADWYWVLQLKTAANESDIQSRYHELTDSLESIKNKFPGTESALELVQSAYAVLSDQEKRSQFDSERVASWGAYGADAQEPCNPCSGGSDLLTENLIQGKATPESSSRVKQIECVIMNKGNGVASPKELTLKRTRDLGGDDDRLTEYGVQNAETSTRAVMLNGICASDERKKKICKQGANWISTCMKTRACGPEKYIDDMGSSGGSGVAHKGSEPHFYNFGNNRMAEAFAVGQVWAAYDQENMPRIYARISSISKMPPFRLSITLLEPAPVSADERRWYEVGLPVPCGPFNLDMKTTTVAESTTFSHMISQVARITDETVEIYPRKGEVWALYIDWKPFLWCSNPETRNGCRFQMVEILTDYSKQEGVEIAYLVKVEGFRSVFQRRNNNRCKSSFQIPASNLFMFSHNVPAFRFAGGEINRVSDGMFELDPSTLPNDLVCNMPKSSEERSSSDSSSFTHFLPYTSPIVSVPQIESLKPRWSAKDFNSDQVWAVYDSPESMPRRYVMVQTVISGTKVCVEFLEPHPMLDDEIHWVEENLPFVCGLFRAGKTTVNMEMSRFSHLIDCERSTKSFFRIYPKKGEIWAIYRSWNRKWKQSDYNGCQCGVVEIISEASKESEMRIAGLVTVQGCMTFYKKQSYDGFELIRTVSRTEMLIFSHKIPAFVVPGIESRGISKGSWHLEPDALPISLVTNPRRNFRATSRSQLSI